MLNQDQIIKLEDSVDTIQKFMQEERITAYQLLEAVLDYADLVPEMEDEARTIAHSLTRHIKDNPDMNERIPYAFIKLFVKLGVY